MPFKSKAQSRWAFATDQPFAEEFAKKTNYGKLPEKKKNKENKYAKYNKKTGNV